MLILAHAALPLLPLVMARRLGRDLPLAWPAVAFGGLLPDLVDKPLGYLILGWGNGRLWGHSLLFLLALAALASALGRAWAPLAWGVFFGAATHLVLDGMWGTPAVLLWPLAGPMPHGTWSFERSLGSYGDVRFLAAEVAGAAALVVAAWDARRTQRSSRARP